MTDRGDLVDEIDRLVYVAWRVDPVRTVRWAGGRAVIDREPATSTLPAVNSAEWWDSPARVRIAALVLLAVDYLRLCDQVKAAAVAVAEGFGEQRELIRRRRDVIGVALRDGDAGRAIALTAHHASDEWWAEHPKDSVAT